MKFVHIADMHFDSPFVNLSEKDIMGDIRRLEQRKVFKKIIEYIQEKGEKMGFFSGCMDARNMTSIEEVKCPKCGAKNSRLKAKSDNG